jgi:transposase InsO family protein
VFCFVSMSSKQQQKKQQQQEAGAGGDAETVASGEAMGSVGHVRSTELTYEQQVQLFRMRAEEEDRARRLRAEEDERAMRLKQMEAENLRLQLELAQAQARRDDRPRDRDEAGRRGFDVHKASAMLPHYEERDVEMYLSNFEKTAQVSDWPRDKWSVILQPKLSGKALKAYDRLTVEQIVDYDVVKQAILDELELVAEVYRAKFRKCTKRQTETYSDFAHYLTILHDRWTKAEGVDSFEKHKQLILCEAFCETLTSDIKVHVREKDIKTLVEMARAADEYAVLHKGAGKIDTSSRPTAGGRGQGQSAPSSSGKNGKDSYREQRENQPAGSPVVKQERDVITCFYCRQPGHMIRDCTLRRQAMASAVTCTVEHCHLAAKEQKSEATALGEYIVPVTVHGNGGTDDDITVACWRDTGAQVSLLMQGSVPNSCLQATGDVVSVLGVTHSQACEVPLYKVKVSSPMVTGEIVVGLTPTSFGMPNSRVPLLLGNDHGPKMSWEPKVDVTVSAVVTRRQARQATVNEQQENTEQVTEQVSPPVSTEEVGGDGSAVMEAVRGLFEPSDLVDMNADQLGELQRQDETLKEAFKLGQKPGNNASGYFVHSNGLLMRRKLGNMQEEGNGKPSAQVIVPYCLRGKVLRLAHDIPASGHLGIGKTRKRICTYFYWPSMAKDIKRYCVTCDVCQRNNKTGKVNREPMVRPPIIEQAFSRISIDIVGPLIESSRGNRFVLTIVDHGTRWVEAYPLPDHKATTVVKSLLDFIARFGIFDEVLHDLGSDFTSELMQVMLNFYGIKQLRSSVAHPQTNTAVERFHRTLKQMLRAFLDQYDADWDDALPHLLFAFREIPVAEYGFSPYELLFGRYVRGPLSVVFDSWWEGGEHQASPHVVDYMLQLRDRLETALEHAHKQQRDAQAAAKEWYDRKARAVTYQAGDKVLVLLPQPGKPLCMKYVGPYKVLKAASPVDYVIEFPEGRKPVRVVHANLMKPYYTRTEFVDRDDVLPSIVAVSAVVVDDETGDDQCLLGPPPPEEFDGVVREKTSHLSPERAKQIYDLLLEYVSVVSDKPGLTNLYVHHIKVKPGSKVIRLRPYRMSPKHQEMLRTEIDRLLADDIIEPSDSEWSSPAILVPKAGGTYRCVVDYRAVNTIVEDESFPMPRIDDLIDRIGQAKYLTKIDLSQSFHQIALDEQSRQFTSFCTPFGQWQYKRLPYGLKTSPIKFSATIAKALNDLYDCCGTYVDDLCIFSATWEQHLQDVEKVLERLQRAGLTLRLAKCYFACAEVDYLGHTVGAGQTTPRQATAQALIDAPPPRNRKQLRSFLGLAGFFQRYIPRYADLTAPLTAMLRKGQDFKWDDVAEHSFTKIKQVMCDKPVLLIANHSKPFTLFIDASNVAVGAVLMQRDNDGELKPVCYFSRKLNDAQRNYAVRDKEALALVLAVRAFRVYLAGPIDVYTDHEPLKFINSMACSNMRLLRWAMELQPYQLSIRHVKGRDNVIADYLSRPCVDSNVI